MCILLGLLVLYFETATRLIILFPCCIYLTHMHLDSARMKKHRGALFDDTTDLDRHEKSLV